MRSYKAGKSAVHGWSDKRRRRALFWRQAFAVVGIGLLVAGFVYGLRLFLAYEGFMNSAATFEGETPQHRVIELTIFFGTALVPAVFYLVWRRCSRRRR